MPLVYAAEYDTKIETQTSFNYYLVATSEYTSNPASDTLNFYLSSTGTQMADRTNVFNYFSYGTLSSPTYLDTSNNSNPYLRNYLTITSWKYGYGSAFHTSTLYIPFTQPSLTSAAWSLHGNLSFSLSANFPGSSEDSFLLKECSFSVYSGKTLLYSGTTQNGNFTMSIAQLAKNKTFPTHAVVTFTPPFVYNDTWVEATSPVSFTLSLLSSDLSVSSYDSVPEGFTPGEDLSGNTTPGTEPGGGGEGEGGSSESGIYLPILTDIYNLLKEFMASVVGDDSDPSNPTGLKGIIYLLKNGVSSLGESAKEALIPDNDDISDFFSSASEDLKNQGDIGGSVARVTDVFSNLTSSNPSTTYRFPGIPLTFLGPEEWLVEPQDVSLDNAYTKIIKDAFDIIIGITFTLFVINESYTFFHSLFNSSTERAYEAEHRGGD